MWEFWYICLPVITTRFGINFKFIFYQFNISRNSTLFQCQISGFITSLHFQEQNYRLLLDNEYFNPLTTKGKSQFNIKLNVCI